jgi:hypothetical protein
MGYIENNQPVFVCCPTHNAQMHMLAAKAVLLDASTRPLIPAIGNSSLLAYGFNTFLCDALNNRGKYNLKWFAMLHADIAPEKFWLDKLITLAEQHNADLLSAVIPFKDASGLTSTALSNPESDFGALMRLTLHQVHGGKLPKTFDLGDVVSNLTTINTELIENFYLLVNTGCMIVRIDQPWSEKLFFTINDTIEKNIDGTYTALVEPEDWFLSKLVAQHGGRVMATSEVIATHLGGGTYPNHAAYGHQHDPNFKPELV